MSVHLKVSQLELLELEIGHEDSRDRGYKMLSKYCEWCEAVLVARGGPTSY